MKQYRPEDLGMGYLNTIVDKQFTYQVSYEGTGVWKIKIELEKYWYNSAGQLT